MQDTWILPIAYLLGTFETGLLVAAIGGVRLRDVGSGNPGAANVMRAMGIRAGLVTMAGDAAKGALAAALGAAATGTGTGAALAGLAAVVGHSYPVWWRFRGGKGVATTVGATLWVVPTAGALACATYLLMLWLTRISSVGSLSAMAVVAVGAVTTATQPAAAAALVGAVLLVVIRHRSNVVRLISGDEPELVTR